jgi:hypothetical protein
VLVIGIGNVYRGDDAAGLAVADRIRVMAPPGIEAPACRPTHAGPSASHPPGC